MGGRQQAALPAKNLKELIAWLKENPGKATVGIGGVGGGADVVGTYFQKNTGTRFPVRALSRRGADHPGFVGRPHRPDLHPGGKRVGASPRRSAQGLCGDGQERAGPAAPDTPTIDEDGVPGLYASFWHGLWAPKGTPKEIIAKLDAASSRPWPIRPCGSGSPSSAGAWPRDKQTPAALGRASRRPRSRSGGRSSRRPASRRSERTGNPIFY